MSSTNKTNNLGLNSWIGSDKPQRIDFNRDNEIIDNVLSQHINDAVVHITQQERELWNSFLCTGIYFGDSTTQRVISLDVDFEVSMVVVFASGRPISVTNFSNQKSITYLALATKSANTAVIKLNDDFKSITVKQESVPTMQNEYATLNENGVAYSYVAFR